jgi:DNA invertase Pin-like site-specific DNA recombinase
MIASTTQPQEANRESSEIPIQIDHRGIAGYIRLTSEESLKGLSARAQRENILRYATNAKLGPVSIYEELKAVGGDVPFEKRAAARKLIADIAADRIRLVIVRDVDRLIREVSLWQQIRRLCIEHGVQIHDFNGNVALLGPSAKFMGTLRAAQAEFEKDQTGERVRHVKRAMSMHGRFVGGSPGFGYRSQSSRKHELIAAGVDPEQASIAAQTEMALRGALYVDEKEAKIVRLIFDWYVHHRLGVRRISNNLNLEGYRRRSGKLWCPEKVRRIINDPTLAGFIAHDEIRYNKQGGKRTPKCKQRLYPGKHDPIITPELWERAQKIKETNTCSHLGKGTAANTSRRYPLCGVLRCPCGAPMSAKPGRTGGCYGYYLCSNRKYRGPGAVGGCDFVPLNTEKLHAAFWEGLGNLINSDNLIDRVFDAAKRIAVARSQERQVSGDSAETLKKAEANLAIWYKRHDSAKSEAEQEAAYRRIVELTSEIKELRKAAETKAVKSAPVKRLAPINRERVARYLKSLASLAGETPDAGKALIRSLAEHHGLQITVKDKSHLTIRLRLVPPGAAGDTDAAEFAVEIHGDARMKADTITEWMREQEGKHRCTCGCDKVLPIRRKHYWQGIPQFHDQCRHKGMSRKRWELAQGLYNGSKVARLLGIGRTTLGRWLAAGKLPMPKRSISNMLLFDPAEIDALVAKLGKLAKASR